MQHSFFLHIPKTGGVSVESLINGQRPKREICLADPSRFLKTVNLAEITGYEFFFAHAALCLRDILPQPLFAFTFLRDPVDRAISAYNHILRDSTILAHKAIVDARLDIVAALAHPQEIISLNFVDVATRMLGSDINLRLAYPDQEAMQLAENLALATRADEYTYRRALRYLSELDFVGFTENFERDLRHLAFILGLQVENVPFENRTTEADLPLPKAVRTPEVEQAVRKYSFFDSLLYDEARAVFWRNDGHSRSPDEITQRELTLRAAAPLRHDPPVTASRSHRTSQRRLAVSAETQHLSVQFTPLESSHVILSRQIQILTIELSRLHEKAGKEIRVRDEHRAELTKYARSLETALRELNESARAQVAAHRAYIVELERTVTKLTDELRRVPGVATR